MFLGGAFTLERRSGLSRLAPSPACRTCHEGGVFLCFLPSAFTIFNGKAKLGDGERKRLNGEELSHFGSNKQKKVGGAGGRVGNRGSQQWVSLTYRLPLQLPSSGQNTRFRVSRGHARATHVTWGRWRGGSGSKMMGKAITQTSSPWSSGTVSVTE